MRIISSRKDYLKQIIIDNDLRLSQFVIKDNKPNQIFIKVKRKDLSIEIVKEGSSSFKTTWNTIHKIPKVTSTLNWQQLTNYYNTWIKEVASELNHKERLMIQRDLFSNTIKSVSPRFVIIYKQALSAEDNNLDEINGMGLRKAFEVLLKDFIIKSNSEIDPQLIKKTWVRDCLEKYIDDDAIKDLAKRISYLGNDHAHYYVQWENKSIEDLKELINLAVRWIELKIDTSIANEAMPLKND